MTESPVFDSENLRGHYTEGFDIDLSWMKKPTQHQYRWRCENNKWMTAHRRVRDASTLVKAFRGSTPTDVYVSTSSWLDPINLPRLRDIEASYPILLDHLVVFDIDTPPFCRRNMEHARQSALALYEWMETKTDYSFMHVAFSGSKGFHLFYEDLQREKFQIPEPKLREETVRKQRKRLLDEVLAAGHNVDPKITADTRRIIRLPGTVHGRTGWKCSIIELDMMSEPFKKWFKTLERHRGAIKIPRQVKQKKIATKPVKTAKKPVVDPSYNYSIEVSSHVAGTKNRSSLVSWLPLSWGEPQQAVEKALEFAEEYAFGATAFWTDGHRTMILVPRAIPRQQLVKITRKMKLNRFHQDLKERHHAWVRITGMMSEDHEWERQLQPVNVLGKELDGACSWPWSSSHLELSKRMGLPFQIDGNDVSGGVEPSIRIVQRA